jgi:hypothetical protein
MQYAVVLVMIVLSRPQAVHGAYVSTVMEVYSNPTCSQATSKHVLDQWCDDTDPLISCCVREVGSNVPLRWEVRFQTPLPFTCSALTLSHETGSCVAAGGYTWMKLRVNTCVEENPKVCGNAYTARSPVLAEGNVSGNELSNSTRDYLHSLMGISSARSQSVGVYGLAPLLLTVLAVGMSA